VWLAYVRVDDVKAATKSARDLGGRVLQDVTKVPNYGWLSVIADPTGTALGLWQARAPR
jgi:predicted enzyme related to lactoylglutathione lyase